MATRRHSSARRRSGVSSVKSPQHKKEKINLKDGNARSVGDRVKKKQEKKTKEKVKFDRSEAASVEELTFESKQEEVFLKRDLRQIREGQWLSTAEAINDWSVTMSGIAKVCKFIPARFKAKFPEQATPEALQFLKKELLGIKKIALKSVGEKSG